MNKIRFLAACIAAATLPLLGMASASASAAKPPPKPQLSTLACQITGPNCTEPVAAFALPSTDDYVPADDAALTATGAGKTWIDLNNDEGDGTQDWNFAQIATVPPPGGGPGAFNFTGFDRHNYGLDPVFEIEFTPFGQDTGLCLQATRLGNADLRTCNGGARQAWIVTGHVPLITSHPGYFYGLSVIQALNAQHHSCLTGRFTRNTVSRCLNRNANSTDTQRWSAIP